MLKKPKILFSVAFIACVLWNCQPKQSNNDVANKLFNELPAVEGYIVKPSLIRQTITVSGTLKPFEETVLMPEVAGRVVEINLPEGKFVKQGTLLVKLFQGSAGCAEKGAYPI